MESATKHTFFKSKKRTPDELLGWTFTKELIGHQLKKHYQACGNEELPSRLLAVLVKLDEDKPPHWAKVKNPNAPAVKREAEEDWG